MIMNRPLEPPILFWQLIAVSEGLLVYEYT